MHVSALLAATLVVAACAAQPTGSSWSRSDPTRPRLTATPSRRQSDEPQRGKPRAARVPFPTDSDSPSTDKEPPGPASEEVFWSDGPDVGAATPNTTRVVSSRESQSRATPGATRAGRTPVAALSLANFDSKLLAAENVSEFLKTFVRSVSPSDSSDLYHRPGYATTNSLIDLMRRLNALIKESGAGHSFTATPPAGATAESERHQDSQPSVITSAASPQQMTSSLTLVAENSPSSGRNNKPEDSGSGSPIKANVASSVATSVMTSASAGTSQATTSGYRQRDEVKFNGLVPWKLFKTQTAALSGNKIHYEETKKSTVAFANNSVQNATTSRGASSVQTGFTASSHPTGELLTVSSGLGLPHSATLLPSTRISVSQSTLTPSVSSIDTESQIVRDIQEAPLQTIRFNHSSNEISSKPDGYLEMNTTTKRSVYSSTSGTLNLPEATPHFRQRNAAESKVPEGVSTTKRYTFPRPAISTTVPGEVNIVSGKHLTLAENATKDNDGTLWTTKSSTWNSVEPSGENTPKKRPIFTPSEILEPSRKAIVIIFPKHKSQQGNSVSKIDDSLNRPVQHEGDFSKTEQMNSKRNMTGTEKNDENITAALVPYLKVSNAIINEQTGRVTSLASNEQFRLSTLSYFVVNNRTDPPNFVTELDERKENRNQVLLTVLITYLNETMPFVHENVAINMEVKDENVSKRESSRDHNNLTTLSKIITKALARLPILNTMMTDFDMADPLSSTDISVTLPMGVTVRKLQYSPSLTATMDEQGVPSPVTSTVHGLPDDLDVATTQERQIETKSLPDTYVSIDDTLTSEADTNPPKAEKQEEEAVHQGKTLVVYVETGDCSQEIAEQILKLEGDHMNDSESVVVEMICKSLNREGLPAVEDVQSAPGDFVSDASEGLAVPLGPQVNSSDYNFKKTSPEKELSVPTASSPVTRFPDSNRSGVMDSLESVSSRTTVSGQLKRSIEFQRPLSQVGQLVTMSKRSVSYRPPLGATVPQSSADTTHLVTVSRQPTLGGDTDIQSRFGVQQIDIPDVPATEMTFPKTFGERKIIPDVEYNISRRLNKTVQNPSIARLEKVTEMSTEFSKKTLRMMESLEKRTTNTSHAVLKLMPGKSRGLPRQSTRSFEKQIIAADSITHKAATTKRSIRRPPTGAQFKSAVRKLEATQDIGTLTELDPVLRIGPNFRDAESETTKSLLLLPNSTAYNVDKLKPSYDLKISESSTDARVTESKSILKTNVQPVPETTRNPPWRLFEMLSAFGDQLIDSSPTRFRENIKPDEAEKEVSSSATPSDPFLLQSATNTDSEMSASRDDTTLPTTARRLRTFSPRHSVTVGTPSFAILEEPSVSEKSDGVSSSRTFGETLLEYSTASIDSTTSSPRVDGILTVTTPRFHTISPRDTSQAAPFSTVIPGGGEPSERSGEPSSELMQLTTVGAITSGRRMSVGEMESLMNMEECENSCRKLKHRPVCAKVGLLKKTFNSLCDVKIESCLVGEAIRIVHTGPCLRKRLKITFEEEEIVAGEQIYESSSSTSDPKSSM